jgi:hypothetical protein
MKAESLELYNFIIEVLVHSANELRLCFVARACVR